MCFVMHFVRVHVSHPHVEVGNTHSTCSYYSKLLLLFVALHSFSKSINFVHAIAILRLIYFVPSSSACRPINEPINSQRFTLFLLHVLLTLVGSRHTNTCTSIIFVFFIIQITFLFSPYSYTVLICVCNAIVFDNNASAYFNSYTISCPFIFIPLNVFLLMSSSTFLGMFSAWRLTSYT